MIKITKEDLWRLKVCAWAYGWSKERELEEFRKLIWDLELEYYWKTQEDIANSIENLKLEISEQTYKQQLMCEFNQDKNRGYGNKYIKRKFR